MEYRIHKQGLLDKISAWDSFLKRKVRLIACGGTALTLLGVKSSTKDIDLFRGKSVHTTALLESPLKEGNHILMKEFDRIYLGVLNYYDIIISKLFRAAAVDIDDCLQLVKSKKKDIDFKLLEKRFRKTASFDISEDKVNKNFAHFLSVLKKEGLTDEK